MSILQYEGEGEEAVESFSPLPSPPPPHSHQLKERDGGGGLGEGEGAESITKASVERKRGNAGSVGRHFFISRAFEEILNSVGIFCDFCTRNMWVISLISLLSCGKANKSGKSNICCFPNTFDIKKKKQKSFLLPVFMKSMYYIF